jgi:hypothetical protein
MVQLPLGGQAQRKQEAGFLCRFLQALQDAAGLDRHGQVGAVDAAHRVHALSGSARSAARNRPASSPTARPVLPPCGTRLTPVAAWCWAQARTTAATSAVLPGRTTASALPRARLAPVLLPGAQVAFGQDVGGAGDVRAGCRAVNRSWQWFWPFQQHAAGPGCLAMPASAAAHAAHRPQTAAGTALLRSWPGSCRAAVAPGAHRALGESTATPAG